jgi:hypothetical protein
MERDSGTCRKKLSPEISQPIMPHDATDRLTPRFIAAAQE